MAASYARASEDITICWEEFAGDRGDPPLVASHGLGQQMIGWRPEFLTALAERGLRVIRFDNRDMGLSTHLEGIPNLQAIFVGDTSSARYTLEDMAGDALAVLDAAGLESAHLLGVSMGGMIAQTVASQAPERVRSLTSIMSTTGERAASQPTEAAQAVLLQPRPTTADEAAEAQLASARVIGSPGMIDEEWERTRGRSQFERAYNPTGFARQLAAIWASGDRTEAVRRIAAPTLVVHGDVDPLVPVAGGRATAAAVEGSELIVLDGMGHDLPRPLWPRIVDAIAAHVERAEARHGATRAA
jgi:pimeloyl-ACP methyl ester carboxylesterase